LICSENLFLVIDTQLIVRVLKSGAGDAPSRLKLWLKEAVEKAGCDFEGHTVGFAISTDLLKEYRFRIGKTLGKPFFLGLDDYLDKSDGLRTRITASDQYFFFVPTKLSPPPMPHLKMRDRSDNKLRDLVAYLLSAGRYSDRAVLFGCDDKIASGDIETMSARRRLPGGKRLKIAATPRELGDLIADH
jgi:hypothetical protein